MQKRWNILQADASTAASLQQELKISEIICRILVQRGITGYEAARIYFRPDATQFHSPWLMKGMDKAVTRVMDAFQQKEKILIFGDYDVDGTTSVAMMTLFLSRIYEASLVDFYIPHRYREGYGISKAGIDFASENGFTLIISLDCGIKSVELIAYARSKGLDFIVCDHHMPDETLPPAIAILNPKQPDCGYPYKELCGCGVGYKFICAITEKISLPAESTYEYLDLLATAIAADIVPVTGENRTLVSFGLKKVNEQPNPGIAALKTLSGTQQPLVMNTLVFMIAPRINAAGRMDDAKKAVRMFLQQTHAEAMVFAELLHADNSDRREADASTTEEALAMIHNDPETGSRMSTVVYQPHWHKGVVGIVASRLIDHFYRPTVVLTQSGDYVAGSARSVSGFNLYEAIHSCRDLLIGYFFAAGLTLATDNVAAFKERFETVVQNQITADLLIPELLIDAEIDFETITTKFYNILRQMEPFGPGNMRPVFITRNVHNTGWCKIVKEQHIRFSLRHNNTRLDGIGFQMAGKFSLLEQNQPIDIVYTIGENEWNGETKLQLKVIDFRLSEANGETTGQPHF
jgi:single-stranded-DNA-specific exonuclease